MKPDKFTVYFLLTFGALCLGWGFSGTVLGI